MSLLIPLESLAARGFIFSHKRCSRCGQFKPITEFYLYRADSSGSTARRPDCKDCKKKATYGIPKPEVRLAAMKRNRQIVLEHLKTHPCVDCGEDDLSVLEFDHVRGEKRDHISRLANGAGEWKLRQEMEKCEVRCCNCHRKATLQRAGWRPEKFGEGAR